MRIVVAGGGLAGLAAALRATELGARVVLLEKGERPGGSFLLSSGYVWSYRDMPTFRGAAPGGDATLQKLILDRLGQGLDWLGSEGGALLSRETGNPLTFGARFDPERTVTALVERIRASGGEILTGTALEALTEDAGRITGVRATSSGRKEEHAADAVILASGGFAANPELVGRHIIRGPGRMPVRAHPRSTGAGFLAALESGALASAGLDEFYGRNLPAPPAEFSPERFVEVSQLYGRHAIAINARGERYADEGADWSETALTRATVRQPGLYAWYLLDAAGLEARVRERTVRDMVETARSVGGTVLESIEPRGACRRARRARRTPRYRLPHPEGVQRGHRDRQRNPSPEDGPRQGPATPALRGREGRAVHNAHGGRAHRGRGLQSIAGGGCEADAWPLRRRSRSRRCLCWRVHERPRLSPRLRQNRRRVGGRRRVRARQPTC